MDVQRSDDGLNSPAAKTGGRDSGAEALRLSSLPDAGIPLSSESSLTPSPDKSSEAAPTKPSKQSRDADTHEEPRVAKGKVRMRMTQSYVCEGDKKDSFYFLGGLGTSGGINWKSTADALKKHFNSHSEAESLPGHDGTMKSLLLYNQEDWDRAAYLAATRTLRESSSEKKVLGGLSTGGLVLLKFAANHPELVRGLIIVGSPFVLKTWWFRYPLPVITFLYRKVPFLRPLYNYVTFRVDDSDLKRGRKKKGEQPASLVARSTESFVSGVKKCLPPAYYLGAFVTQNTRTALSFVLSRFLYGETPPPPTKDQVANAGYTDLPLKSFVSFYLTQLHARRALEKLQCHVLFVYGKHDHYGTIESAKKMFDKIPVPNSMKRFEVFDHSPHSVMLGVEKERFLDVVVQWKRELDAREAEQSRIAATTTTAPEANEDGQQRTSTRGRLWNRFVRFVARNNKPASEDLGAA